MAVLRGAFKRTDRSTVSLVLIIAILEIVFLVTPLKAMAHYGELYGFGIRSSASAAASSTRCDSVAHAAYYNPALLGCDAKWHAEVNYAHTVDVLKSISGVRTSSATYPTQPPPLDIPSGSVQTDYPNSRALQIGVQLPVMSNVAFFRDHHVKFGVSVHLNTDHLASVNSGYAFEPAYTLYDRRDHHAFLAVGTGWEILKDSLWAGLGAQFYFTAGISAVMVYDQTNTAGQTATDVDPRVALITGLRWKMFDRLPMFVSLVYHQESNQKVKASARTDITISGGGQPFTVTSQSSVYNEPHRLRVGLSWERENWSFETNCILSLWRYTSTSRTQLEFTSPAKASLSSSNRFQNAFSVLSGGHWKGGIFDVMGGLGWHQSIVSSMSGAENELDTDKIVAGAGLYVDLEWMNDLKVGVAYQLQYLIPRTVTKDDASFLGAPGYKVGGQVHQVEIGFSHDF